MNNEPFLRWAGGKRWLAPKIAPFIRPRISDTYYECFLGGGALFFEIEPTNAVLSDINTDLINAYRCVKTNPDEIINRLKNIEVNKKTYNIVRSNIPTEEIDKAVRFIYLNRTCYGGLYRTNGQGAFNVPYGGGSRTPHLLWERNILKNSSSILNSSKTKLIKTDFSNVIEQADKNDVVYCDPTYATVVREKFDRYNGQIFSWYDQKRLAQKCIAAYNRGALIIISNVFNRQIKDLYSDAFFIQLRKNKAIGNKPKNQKNGFEYLIILDPKKDYKNWENLKNSIN